MKKSLVLVLAVALCGCQSRMFTDLPETGNSELITPALLAAGDNTLLLTDYLPQWERADSVTSAGLAVRSLAPDWSEFTVTAPAGVFASTLEAWSDGRCISIAAIGGERDDDALLFTEGQILKVVSIHTSCKPAKVVALWQNCRLPEKSIVDNGDSFGVIIPKDAKDMERSFLRVFAVSDCARFNDVLVPLDRGNAVKEAAELDRHDRQAQVLYSLMIDRFNDANASNNHPLNRPDVLPQVDYQGGDLKGITAKIDEGFFDDLGITTLWISPVTQNPLDAWGQYRNPDTKFSGYHGYWPIYMTSVDSRYGTPDELRELLATAHAHGMNVILDYVAHHLHIDSPVLKDHPDWIIPLMLPDGRENLELWDEQRLTTWFDKHIPTLDLGREEVCELMTDSALVWVAKYDFDGFRHDACKHIPENYWRTLTKKMKTQIDRPLWQIGETYGSPELIASYVRSGMIDAQFDFTVYHTALDVLTRGASVQRLAAVVDESSAIYGAHHTMGNITGNHDKARLISIAGGALSPDEDHKAAGWNRKIGVGDPVGYRKLALLDAVITTIPGVPCIYQGDEYGEPGGNDPDNRRMMRFSGYSPEEQTQLDLTRSLVHLRRTNLPLIYGDMATLALADNVWVFARIYMGEYTIVAVNTGGAQEKVSCRIPAGLDVNQKLKANFGAGFGLTPDGALSVTLPPYGFEILTKTK